MSLANRIFTATNFEIKSSFQKLTETTFRSSAQSIDFGYPVTASEIINSWCAEQTNNLIKDVIQPGMHL